MSAILHSTEGEEALQCETCIGGGRVVETIDVDVPGHPHYCRGGSYEVWITCPDCEGTGTQPAPHQGEAS
jgi:DnaJ-class molecular chaperone